MKKILEMKFEVDTYISLVMISFQKSIVYAGRQVNVWGLMDDLLSICHIMIIEFFYFIIHKDIRSTKKSRCL